MAKDQINSQFEQHTYDFFEDHRVLPLAYRQKGKPTQIFDQDKWKSEGTVTPIDATLTIDDPDNFIAYAKLEKEGGSFDFNAYKINFFKLKDIESPENYVRVWFLPWASNHATRMTIPPKAPPLPGQDMQYSDIFLTAALSGCSVFITGSPQEPTIWHCGTESARSNPTHTHHYADAANHWRGLVRAQMAVDQDTSRLHEINRGMYRKYGTSDYTRMAEQYKTFLENDQTQIMQVQNVATSGCVFGIRTNDDWAFYLQKNMSISVVKLRKKKAFLKKTRYLPVTRTRQVTAKKSIEEIDAKTVHIPAQLYKIFPAVPKSLQSARLDPESVRLILGAYVR